MLNFAIMRKNLMLHLTSMYSLQGCALQKRRLARRLGVLPD